jgi:LmbE family N-acetylglucosaminyl deacetylase
MIVVVSPHLDDAALSVPCWSAARAMTEDVVVLTVFSAGDDAAYAGRRAEDEAALAVLGARAVHLGLLDAPFRLAVARSWRGLVLSAMEDADVAEVGRAIAGWVEMWGAEVVLLPLGVGEHVDHRVVHAAHAGICGRVVGFYEDRPYAGIHQAVRARLARLGAVVDGDRISGSAADVEAFLMSAREAPHVRAYLPAEEREACLAPLARPLVERAAASGLTLRSEAHTFDSSLQARAARAVQVYASQVGDLFGGPEAVHAAYAGAYVERVYWRQGCGGQGPR